MRWVIFTLIIYLFFPIVTNASSSYVLPYPSFMPGNPLYKISAIKDEILKYWYFGTFAQFKYNLNLADKHLVEAKTLFEYKQYLLASNALKKSDFYFSKILPTLLVAKNEGKDISNNTSILKQASLKHVEILSEISREVPQEFLWQPEKKKPIELKLKELLENSISVRERI